MSFTAVELKKAEILPREHSEIGSDMMKPIAAPVVGGTITFTIHVLILVPVLFALMRERALRGRALRSLAASLIE